VLLFSFLLCWYSLSAQIKVYEQDKLGVVIHADLKLDILTAYLKSKPRAIATNPQTKSGVIHSGKGFRVQIYNGNEREEANQLKMDFVRKFPNIKTYLTYIQPQYRVKVGDFTNRGDAQKFANQISKDFSPVIIVPDIVEINTFKND
jgi:hypothetical protein